MEKLKRHEGANVYQEDNNRECPNDPCRGAVLLEHRVIESGCKPVDDGTIDQQVDNNDLLPPTVRDAQQ